MIKEPVSFIKWKHYNSIQIYNHIYRKSLQIFWWDLKKFYNDYHSVCEWLSYEYIKNCKWIAIWWDKRNVIWMNELELQTLIHELQHVMFYRYNKTCSEIDTTNIMTQEFFCYNIEFCLNMIRRTELSKKLKRWKE